MALRTQVKNNNLIEGAEVQAVKDFTFLGSKIIALWWLHPWNNNALAPWEESYDKTRQHIQNQKHHFANKSPYSQNHGVSSSQVWMWELDHKEDKVRKNCSFKLWCWGRLLRVLWTARSNQSILKEIHWKDWCWSWRSSALAAWHEELTHWKRPWCWEWLKASGEEGSRGWDGQMASPTQWTWVWANSRRQWRAGKPGVLQSMGWQRLGHDLVTEQQ